MTYLSHLPHRALPFAASCTDMDLLQLVILINRASVNAAMINVRIVFSDLLTGCCFMCLFLWGECTSGVVPRPFTF